MKNKVLSLFIITSLLAFGCTKPSNGSGDDVNDDPIDNPVNPTPVDPDADLPAEIKDGDTILVTNEKVERFITEVNYPEKDYTETHILDEAYGPTAPGNSDKPQEFTIRWKAEPEGEAPVVKLWEDDGWNREYTNLYPEDHYQTITNLRPNANYHYEVKAGDKVLTSGSFKTTGHVHQLTFYARVRNVRDLGGWQTKDGKTVKYRKVYRGGRMENSTMTTRGQKDVLAEGIRAQLDLRGERDVLAVSPLGPDFIFCAPVIEEGYSQLLKEDHVKCAQCMQFIIDCIKEDNPVYFHCSLGRDRTGTIAMLVLGLLGVDEGVISKEYELTQFAPHGWATSDGEKTKMTRKVDYKGAANVIWGYVGEGETFADGVEKFLIEIGISKEDIDIFRSLMLE